MRKKLFLSILGLLVTGILSDAAAADARKVVVAYQTGASPYVVGIANGDLARQTGWDIEFRRFNSGAEIFAAIASGDVQIGDVGSSPYAAAASRELKVKGVYITGGSGEGEAFFGPDGQPSEAIRQMLEFLGQVSRSQDAADAACALLAQYGLLEPWPLKVRDGERERAVGGLLRVNEAALNTLSADALLALRSGGALALAYAQLLSMGNVSLLGQLAAAHAGAASQAQAAHPNGNGDLTKLFKADDGHGMIDWKKLLDD